jgi:hypothetical protein
LSADFKKKKWNGKSLSFKLLDPAAHPEQLRITPIDPGDNPLRYSNGATEARNPENEEFGIDCFLTELPLGDDLTFFLFNREP